MLPSISGANSQEINKLFEMKIREQTVELASRAKIIEELKINLMVLIDKYNELKRNNEEVKDKKKDKDKSATGIRFHVTGSSKSSKNVADLSGDPSLGISLGTGLNGLLNNRRSMQSSKGKPIFPNQGFGISKFDYKILPDYNYNIDTNGMKYSDRIVREEINEYIEQIRNLKKSLEISEEKLKDYSHFQGIIEKAKKESLENNSKIISLGNELELKSKELADVKDSYEKVNDKYQKYKCKYKKFQTDEEDKLSMTKQLEELKIKSEAEIRRLKKNELQQGDKIKELESELIATAKILEKVRNENLTLSSKANELQGQNIDLLKEKTEHSDTIKRLQSEKEWLSKRVAEMENRFEQASELEQIYKDSLSEKEKILNFFIQERKNIFTNITESVQQLVNSHVKTITQRMQEVEKKSLTALQNSKKKIENLKAKLVHSRKNIEKLRQSVKQAKTIITEMSGAKEVIISLESQTSKFNEKHDALKKKYESLEVENTKQLYQIQNYEKALKEQEKKNKKMLEANNELQKTIVKLNKSIETVRTDISKGYIEEIKNLKDILESEKNHKDLLSQNLDNAENLLNQYKVENEGKSKIIEERNVEIKAVREKLLSLNKNA